MKKLLLSLLLFLPLTALAEDLWDEYRGTLKVADPTVSAYEFPNSMGAFQKLEWVTTEVTLTGASTAATGLIPAKASYYGCVARVTTAVTGAASWDLGDGTDVDRWGDNEALTVGTRTSESDFTAVPYGWSATALNPTFTAVSSNFTGGKIRISCLISTMDGPAK